MTNREVAMIVRDAEGLDGLDFAHYVLDHGVTLEEYRRYSMRKTMWLLVRCVLAVAAAWVVTEILTGRAGR